MEKIIRQMFAIRSLPNKSLLRQFMGDVLINFIDVGATGNPKGVWREALNPRLLEKVWNGFTING